MAMPHSPLNKYANAINSILTKQYNPWNNSTNKTQGPEVGCINIRNMFNIKLWNNKASDNNLVSLYSTQKNVERLSEMIPSNRRLTIREMSENLNISCGFVRNILTNRFGHEASECEICSTCFDGRTKATALVNFIEVPRSCLYRF